MQRTTFVELCKWDCRATRNGGGDDGHAKTMANCSSNNVETVADPYGRGAAAGAIASRRRRFLEICQK
jgi:hypothetical protein